MCCCCSEFSWHNCCHIAHCIEQETFSSISNKMMLSSGWRRHWFSWNQGIWTGRSSLMCGGGLLPTSCHTRGACGASPYLIHKSDTCRSSFSHRNLGGPPVCHAWCRPQGSSFHGVRV